MATGDKTIDPVTGEPEVELADGSKTTDWAALMGGAADETSVAEYRVAWGGSAGGSNASSSSPYYSPDDIITLDKDGDYTFDVLPYQKTFSQENGTATGGIFYLKTSTGSTIETLTFPWKKRDSNESFFPYEGGRQTIHRANMTAGTYRLSFTSWAGSGSGNRVSYEGYAHVIARRASLASGEAGAKAVLITGSLGPGAGGTVNVPLADDGKALFDVAMKLSNGTSFSPPLDTDDGVNRWWYDFDHTTGEITTSRFGAFTGGAYRVVAYYA